MSPGSAILDSLRAAGPPTSADLDLLLSEHDVPLIEGSSTTFLYRGEARSVRLQHWIWGLRSSQTFSRLDGTDLWYLVMQLPSTARIEYKLEVEDDDGTRLIHDPLNPRVAPDPFGGNSVLQTQGYVEPEWTLPDSEARPGRLEELELESRAFGDRRRVTIYLPARFRRRRKYLLLLLE